jgi:hypothetical protein
LPLKELATGSLNVLLTRRPGELGDRLRFEALREDEAVVVAGPRHTVGGRAQVVRRSVSGAPAAASGSSVSPS